MEREGRVRCEHPSVRKDMVPIKVAEEKVVTQKVETRQYQTVESMVEVRDVEVSRMDVRHVQTAHAAHTEGVQRCLGFVETMVKCGHAQRGTQGHCHLDVGPHTKVGKHSMQTMEVESHGGCVVPRRVI